MFLRTQSIGTFGRRTVQLHLTAAQSTIAPVTKTSEKQLPTGNSSFVDQLKSEWGKGKPFNQLPGLSRYQMWRGFKKGGEFENNSVEDVMLKCRQRYGDTYLLPGLFGMPSNVVTFDVTAFEKIFRTEGNYPVRHIADPVIYYRQQRADGFFNDCLGLISNGEQWGRMRHAANPVLMQHRNVALYLEPMQKVNKEFIKHVREIRDATTQEVPGDFLKDINHLAFESIAVVALDRQMGLIRNAKGAPDAEKLFKNLEIFLKSLYDLGIKPSLYKYVRTPTYKRFERAMDEIFDTTSMYVNEALKRIEATASNGGPHSVLESLIKIDRKFAIVMAMDMLMSAVDTTATVLTGVLLCLAKNHDKQTKLRQEILSVLPKESDEFTLESMKSLPYLRACIKESLRLYPIVFGNLRCTGTDLVLGGYRVPKGTRVMMNSNLLLREEKYYPRAKEFIPERWLRQKNIDEKLIFENQSPFIFLPFGFGPRMCIGKRIVDIELELTISNLVRNFKIDFDYPTENAFECAFIKRPAIPLKFKFRDLNRYKSNN